MMRKPMLLAAFLFASFYAVAQRDTTLSRQLGFGYFAQGGSHPGITATLEKQLMNNGRYQFLIAAKAGVYFHYRNNTGIFIMGQSGQRYRIAKHFYGEHFLGLGFLQTFLNGGDAYFVNASGQIQKASKVGNLHVMPSISFGLTYALKSETAFFLRPMIYWAIPFNQSALVQYALEAGVSVRLKR